MLRKPLAPKHLPKASKTVVRERAISVARSETETDTPPALRQGLKILGRGKAEPVHARKRGERRQPC